MSGYLTIEGKSMVWTICPDCKTLHAFERTIYDAAIQRRPDFTIHCPNGHGWHYKSEKEKSDEERIRQERDRLKQQLAQKDDEIAEARRAAAAAEKKASTEKGKVTRLMNRAKAGVCPCCNRTFTNLARHMASKHKGEEATVQ